MKLVTSTGSSYELTEEQTRLAFEVMKNGGVLHLKNHQAAIKGTAIMEITESDTKEEPRLGRPLQLPDKAKLTLEEEEAKHKRQREMMEKLKKEFGDKWRRR